MIAWNCKKHRSPEPFWPSNTRKWFRRNKYTTCGLRVTLQYHSYHNGPTRLSVLTLTWLKTSNVGPQQTPACRISSKLEYLTVCCCCVPTPGGPNLNHKSVCVHAYVPMSDEIVASLQDLILWEICQGEDQQSGIRGSSLTQEKTHVKTFRVDIPFSLVCWSLTGLS